MMQRQTEFQSEHIPHGYLITFRAYGTWLPGRPGSVDRFQRYLWTEQDLINAIAYVLYDQGEPLP